MKKLITALCLIVPLCSIGQEVTKRKKDRTLSSSSTQLPPTYDAESANAIQEDGALEKRMLSLNHGDFAQAFMVDSSGMESDTILVDKHLYDKRLRLVGSSISERYSIVEIKEKMMCSVRDIINDGYYYYFKINIVNGSKRPFTFDSLTLKFSKNKKDGKGKLQTATVWQMAKKILGQPIVGPHQESYVVFSVPRRTIYENGILQSIMTESASKRGLALNIPTQDMEEARGIFQVEIGNSTKR